MIDLNTASEKTKPEKEPNDLPQPTENETQGEKKEGKEKRKDKPDDPMQVKKRREYSKYDFIKVKVTLDEHFYVLSRFLVRRMLALCKIPQFEAIALSKDLKKFLVEADKVELPQSEMNEILFQLMKSRGYGDQYINRYKMLSRFYQKRVPMIVFLSGTIGIAKSILATHLAERMSISNVLQTEIMESVLQNMYPELFPTNFKLQEFSSEKEMIADYESRCRQVRRGANTDVNKGLSEGKPLIIEGFTVDPSLYVRRVDKDSSDISEEKVRELDEIMQKKESINMSIEKLVEVNVSKHMEDKYRIVIDYPIEGFNENDREKKLRAELDKQDQKAAVMVPILLVMNREDHYYCIENKLESAKQLDKLSPQERIAKINAHVDRYQAIQRYLIKKAQLCTIVPINLQNIEKTLDLIQDIIIEKIEAGYQREDF